MRIVLIGERGKSYSHDFSNGVPEAVVGRARSADFQVKIPASYKVKKIERTGNLGYLKETPKAMFVSRHHCRFEVKDGKVYVKDLGSENGTYVDGNRLNGESVELKDNSVLNLGEHCPLRVRLVERKSLLDRLRAIF